jgi:4-O-beta-D-mannosyl-D-glucose phosphorylase
MSIGNFATDFTPNHINQKFNMQTIYETRLFQLASEYEHLMYRSNNYKGLGNGILDRYDHPVLTIGHLPLTWQYDLNPETNPYLMLRRGVLSIANAGAIAIGDKIALMTRLQSFDGQFFFALAESATGVDRFRFRNFPTTLPIMTTVRTNIFNLRLTPHEDGWIYALYNLRQKEQHGSAATYHHAVARTKDLQNWESLPDLAFSAPAQRLCLLHPALVNGKYLVYSQQIDQLQTGGSRMQITINSFDDWPNPACKEESKIQAIAFPDIETPAYLLGPCPIKTELGWIHLCAGLRRTSYGWRHILQVFLTDLNDPSKVLSQPGGHFLELNEKDKSSPALRMLHSNGWAVFQNKVFLYYTNLDNRVQVVSTPMERLLDYITNTPQNLTDASTGLKMRLEMIEQNQVFMNKFHL